MNRPGACLTLNKLIQKKPCALELRFWGEIHDVSDLLCHLEPVFGNQRLDFFKVLPASFVSKRRHPSMINDCLSHMHTFVCSGVKFVAAACFFGDCKCGQVLQAELNELKQRRQELREVALCLGCGCLVLPV